MKRPQPKFLNDIERQYSFVNKPSGSTSFEHRALHKIYISWRLKTPYFSELGKLCFMKSESPLHTKVPNDNYVRYVDGKFVLEPNYSLAEQGTWFADSTEEWQKKTGERVKKDIAVEVLPKYPINVFIENTRKGSKLANRFRDYLFDNDLINTNAYSNLTGQIKDRNFGKDLGVNYKRLHFWLVPGIDHKKVDYGECADCVDKVSEIERKHFLWDYSTNYLVFVVFEHNAQDFKEDLEHLMKKKGQNIRVPVMYCLQYSSFDSIVSENGGLPVIHKTTKPLIIDRKLSKRLFRAKKICGW
jgi:hypothetical protein